MLKDDTVENIEKSLQTLGAIKAETINETASLEYSMEKKEFPPEEMESVQQVIDDHIAFLHKLEEKSVELDHKLRQNTEGESSESESSEEESSEAGPSESGPSGSGPTGSGPSGSGPSESGPSGSGLSGSGGSGSESGSGGFSEDVEMTDVSQSIGMSDMKTDIQQSVDMISIENLDIMSYISTLYDTIGLYLMPCISMLADAIQFFFSQPNFYCDAPRP